MIICNLITNNQWMSFVYEQHFLELDSHPRRHQDNLYYKWQGKKHINKLIQQQCRLKTILETIIKDESQSQHKLQKHKRIKTTVKDQRDFYQYNLDWKNRIDQRINNQRQILTQIKHQQQASHLYPQPPQTISIDKFTKGRIKHKGPISAWQQRFNHFIQMKNHPYDSCYSESHFHPKINKKSQQLVKGFHEPVEERLIRYGQMLKIKKQQHTHELQNQYNQPQRPLSNGSDDIFTRLYKEAEIINRARNQQPQQYTFKPQTIKLSEQIEEKIRKTRKPLYYTKSKQKEQNSESETKVRSQIHTSESSLSFNNFLKRNEALLNYRKNLQTQKMHSDTMKQKQKQDQCTFTPTLNTKSVTMFKTKALQEQQRERLREIYNLEVETLIRTTQRIRTQPSYNHLPSQIQISNNVMTTTMMSDSLNHSSQEKEPESTSPRHRTQNRKGYLTNANQDSGYIGQISGTGVIAELYEEDSIEKAKQTQWESQMKQVEDQIQSMMRRALENSSFQ